MFINKLNQLYKPERILYYIDASDEDISNFYNGTLNDEISRYTNTFGTYDYPGIFYLNDESSASGSPEKVIGIEFRTDDKNINYPKNLKSLILKEAFFYSIEIDNDNYINYNSIRDIFEKIAMNDDAHRAFSHLSINNNPKVIGVFPDSKKIRIQHEWKLDRENADPIINENINGFDKQFLFDMAFIDPITKHPNWNHLLPYLEMPKAAGIKDYTFVHFDVKEFRVLNEVYGHIVANKVLSNISNAMKKSEYVYASARCHNDNFAMMIKDMPDDQTVKFLEDFFESISHIDEDPNYKIYYRCGVVPMQRAILSGNRVADAGKLAQSLGTTSNRTDITIYTDKMHDDILWGNFIKAYVDTAIKNDEFVVYLQPKFDIQKEKIKGAEALIRWNYKNKEFMPPYRFIPFFEKDGSIDKIDDIVLKKVCEVLSEWKKEGRELYPISVNLSRTRLYDNGLIEYLTGIVDSYGVDHSLIDFELTESASYDDMEQIIFILNGLRAKGFKISMDDFGTGYSSLSLLTQMPLDTLKIDKSFVDKVGSADDSEKDLTVIRHIISLAKELNFTCLAEGAEHKPQVDKLRNLGCEVIQGYYYSKPIPIKEYENKYL